MKKRFLHAGSMVVALMGMLNIQSFGSANMPDDPYTPEFILASHAAANTPSKGNPFEELVSPPQDTIPLEDRTGDFLNNPSQNPFDLQDPASVEQTVEYDPETGNYIITEKIGNDYFRPPTFMTFDEYLEHQAQQQEQEYFNALSGSASGRGSTGRIDPLAKVDIKDKLIERLFGGTEVDIKPQGNIDLTFGVEFNNTLNPTLPERAQRQGGFDFDMAIQMNVDGKIGEKLKLNTNYNTQATFDFDNTMKLEYNTDQFGEDDIIKKIEAGNVSLPLRSTLIQGSQSLFGIKTELQFGRLRLNMVASQQKSQREAITLEGGSQYQEFEVKADDYDENRHFFLTHYNRNNFEESLEELPLIKTLFTILNIEVWVTDTRNSTENIRDIIAISDLGETNRFTNPEQQALPIPFAKDLDGEPLPDNSANDLYARIFADPRAVEVNRVVNVLKNEGLQQGRDFEKVTARQLSPSEFTYHPNLGFVSLNLNIQPDQVVGVAFEYSYRDKIYRVGQISQDQSQSRDSITQNVLFVKMLKSTIQPVDLPTWDLMMKNVYNVGAYNVAREDFELGVYFEDPGEGIKQFMPAQGLSEIPLLRVFNLDQLNVQLDPQPDGVFDFVEGLTINTKNGRIMFPVLEPFGSSLEAALTTEIDKKKFVYNQLYDLTLFNAREFQEFNRFLLKGSYKSSVTSEITLPGFNIPEETILVYSGGSLLVLGKDYVIEGNRVRITNDAYLNSGAPIKIEFEDNSLFGFQTKTMLGVRADYELSKHLTLGATYMHLFERPYTQKVNIGDDPINNRIYGFDINYSNDAPWLTRLVDKLPLYSTKQMSSINFMAETAILRPGHAKAINEDSDLDNDDKKGGVVYIDDFEGAVTPINLTSPFIGVNGWMMSSIPHDNPNEVDPIFPEAFLIDTTLAGVNRAHLSWYSIDQSVSGNGPYGEVINQTEVFPNRTQQNTFGAQLLRSLDLAYDPTRRGPYNFDLPNGTEYSAGLDINAKLEKPETRWAGIMRQMTTNDFQSSNIEFLEFWMMSPYMDTILADAANLDALDGGMNGELVINFGSVSEDIMPDSRKFFENGLPGPNTRGLRSTETGWGAIPLTPQITNNFDTDEGNRAAQDVGLDGLNDEGERRKFAYYLNALSANGGSVTGAAIQAATADPSNDNFRHFRDYDNDEPISVKYDRYFGLEGNTPINQGQNQTRAATTVPDGEDLDGDRTVNETESYFEYRVPIVHDPNELEGRGMNINDNPFITESRVSTETGRVYYRFRIPLNLPDSDTLFRKVGGIRDFRSIRFMRMYLKGFSKPVNIRFATLDLVRSQWRRYTRNLKKTCEMVDLPESSNTSFDINAVNIEENIERQPFGYALPPGISREQALGVNLNALQNEQALSIRVCELEDSDSRGVFKNTELDLRVYRKLKMFLHAENTRNCGVGDDLKDGDLNVFIRLGSDINSNYYEYEMPITMSRNDSMLDFQDKLYPRIVWPQENDISIDLSLLEKVKELRNASSIPINDLYTVVNMPGEIKDNVIFRVRGNPNLGLVKSVMIGVKNPVVGDSCDIDLSDKKSIEIWVNELRAYGLDERGGVAGLARLDLKIADLGSLTFSGKGSTIGFGSLDQRVNDRQKERNLQYDVAGNFELSKFLPEKMGLSLPFYFQYSKEVSTPQFDPYDLDLEFDKKLSDAIPAERDSIRDAAQTVKTIKSYNFTNVRKERSRTDKPPMPWDISNFALTYAFDETTQRDPIVENDVLTRRRGALDYNYSRPVTYIEPLKKAIKSKHLKFLANMNLNPLPNSFAFSTDLDRRFNVTKYRFAGLNPLFNTYYNKQFLWNRTYDVQWDLTRNLKIQFNADNNALIDEPNEVDMQRRHLDPTSPDYISDIDSYRRDSIWNGLTHFGRNKRYQHGLNATYKVPLDDFPFMDWIGVKASYRAGYNWDAASLTPTAQAQGNIIANTQNRQINGDFDFEKLYNYFPYLKKINNRPRGGRSGAAGSSGGRSGKDKSGKDTLSKDGKSDKQDSPDKKDTKNDKKNSKGKKGDVDVAGNDKKSGKGSKDDKKKDRDPSGIERAIIRPLMAIRKARLNYQEDFGTTVPGFLPKSELFGQQDFSAPGWGFVAGLQPNIKQGDFYTDKDWLYSNWQWITGDPLLSRSVQQNYSQKLDGKVTIEPFKDFRIDVEASRTVQENHEENFRRLTDPDPNNPTAYSQSDLSHQNPIDFGMLQVSYWSGIKTIFEADAFSLFQTFKSNRVIIANRLTDDLPGSHSDSTDAAAGFPKGYGRNNRDVQLPAFIAAYSGQDASSIKVSNDYLGSVLLKSMPQPNWRLTYNGLSKLVPFQEYFQSISISHAYKGTMSISSYRTNTGGYDPEDPLKLVTESTQEEPTTNPGLNYYTRFRVPDIQIQEQFSPLFGIDARLKNDMSFKAEFSKSRTLAVSFINSGQLNETLGSNLTLGFGYKLKDVQFGFLASKKKKKSKTKKEDTKPGSAPGRAGGKSANEPGSLDITFDFSIRDDETNQYDLDTDTQIPTRGNRTVSILPQATYQLNKQLSLRFFFDYRHQEPKTTQGYPTTNVRSGVTVRFSLD